MARRYRIQCEFGFWNDLCVHILLWALLTFFTGGLAALVYPFYFVRFMASHMTIIEEAEYRIRENKNFFTQDERERLKEEKKREREEKKKFVQYEFSDMEPPQPLDHPESLQIPESEHEESRVRRPIPTE